MKIHVLDLTDLAVTEMEAALQFFYDRGFRIVEIAGANRHLIILWGPQL